MTLHVGQLIDGHDSPTCVYVDDTVRMAIQKMHEKDYSQLPVIDDREYVVGLITEKELRRMLAWGFTNECLDHPVHQWMHPSPMVVGETRSVYDVAKLLAHEYAVIIGRNRKAIGIITDYDIAVFLAEWSKGIAYVEDIESRLRGYIKRIYTTEKSLQDALERAFGTDGGMPRREYEELTLKEHVQLIITDKNWPAFRRYFTSKPAFTSLIDNVVPIRNKITHFRGHLSTSELKTLEEVQTWLQQCPLVPE